MAVDPDFSADHTYFSCISASLGGIVLAGLCYAPCLFLIAIFVQLPNGGPQGFLDFVMALLMVISVGGGFGVVISVITGFVSIVVVYFINRSLGYPLDEVSAMISAGSMAGYMPTVSVVFMASQYSNFQQVAIVGAMGPLLAMCMGAVGAGWGAMKWGDFDLSQTSNRKHKLSVLHLMMVTAWVALTFAIANAMGGLEFAIATGAWFVLQAVMLAVFGLFRQKIHGYVGRHSLAVPTSQPNSDKPAAPLQLD